MDIDGKQLDSMQIAEFISRKNKPIRFLLFVVGGSYGLSQDVKTKLIYVCRSAE